MEDELLNCLERYGLPVIRQGSMPPEEEYPDHFFTFWNSETQDYRNYDNRVYGTIYDFDVNFYSKDPKMVYNQLKKTKKDLEEAGFRIPGKGHDIGSDYITHTGRGMNVIGILLEEE